MNDPKPKEKCAGCGGPRLLKRRRGGQTNGTRLPAPVWKAALELDAFCSTECARRWHGVEIPRGEMRVEIPDSCLDCGKALGSRNTKAGLRCRTCGDKFRKARKFSVPGCCAGCGIPLGGDFTEGCSHCNCRRRKQWRRANEPGYRERENEISRRGHRRRYRKLAAARRVAAVEPNETAPVAAANLKEAA